MRFMTWKGQAQPEQMRETNNGEHPKSQGRGGWGRSEIFKKKKRLLPRPNRCDSVGRFSQDSQVSYFFFFFFLRAAGVAYGSSKAKG